MPAPLAPIPRRPYAIAIALAGAASVALGVVVAGLTGGDANTQWAVGLALAAAAALSALPLLSPAIIPPSAWGMVVLAVSAARTLLVLAAILILTAAMNLPRHPVAYGLLAGAVLLMIAEAAAAVRLLSARESARQPKNPLPIGPRSAHAEPSGSAA